MRPPRFAPCCETCLEARTNPLPVRTSVMVQRDTKRWPRAGTWKRYDGQTGFVDVVNVEREAGEVFHVEYGITLGSKVSWFLPHEVRERV